MKGIAPEIEASVRAKFSPSESEQALRMLADMHAPSLEPDFAILRARVQIGVLILSKGSIELLTRAVRDSQIDWRDTLVASGLAELDTWAKVANAAGFTAPAAT